MNYFTLLIYNVMKINMTPKEDPLNEAQITDNTPVDTVETPTEDKKEAK